VQNTQALQTVPARLVISFLSEIYDRLFGTWQVRGMDLLEQCQQKTPTDAY
jgi:hypothetical protein